MPADACPHGVVPAVVCGRCEPPKRYPRAAEVLRREAATARDDARLSRRYVSEERAARFDAEATELEAAAKLLDGEP